MQCYYHPNQPLVNFCTNPQCALPLCPKCISLHTSQSPRLPHALLPFDDLRAQLTRDVGAAIQSLLRELNDARETNSPETRLKLYLPILENKRTLALGEINRHYDNLQRELHSELDRLHAQYLQGLIQPLEQQVSYLDNLHKSLQQPGRAVEAMIRIVSEEVIPNLQTSLLSLHDRKEAFLGSLPVLQEVDNLRMVVAVPKRGTMKAEVQREVTDRSDRLELAGAKLMSLRQNATF